MSTIDCFVSPETDSENIFSGGVVTLDGIMAKHDLGPKELFALMKKVLEADPMDALFEYPDGPEFDFALMIAQAIVRRTFPEFEPPR